MLVVIEGRTSSERDPGGWLPVAGCWLLTTGCLRQHPAHPRLFIALNISPVLHRFLIIPDRLDS